MDRWLALGLCLLALGCTTGDEPELVVYAALDEEFSDPILKDFAQQSNLKVAPKYDTEATKTVGLANAILAEKERPRCDVFWNNEILNTLRLQQAGLLEAYVSPQAERFPAMYRSANGLWHGFAGRARVLIVNTQLVPNEADWPRSIRDLADAKWRGRCGMAKPLFGTTATHAACLFAAWGEEQAKAYFQSLLDNEVQILAGNKQVALGVVQGQIAFGITDTDDAIIEVEKGAPVAIVYPDQGDDQPGTLFIPNTLAIIRGCPHPDAARKLVDHLLTPAVEKRLAEGASAQIPLGKGVETQIRVETPHTVKAMQVDFGAAAKQWDAAASYLREAFAN